MHDKYVRFDWAIKRLLRQKAGKNLIGLDDAAIAVATWLTEENVAELRME